MSAVASPASVVRAWSFTVAGTPLTTGDTIIDFTAAATSQVEVNPNQSSGTTTQPQTLIQLGPTKYVDIFNDNANAGSSIFVNLNSIAGHATGGTPGDGTTGSNTFILLATADARAMIRVYGQFTGVGLQSSSSTSACRVIAYY